MGALRALRGIDLSFDGNVMILKCRQPVNDNNLRGGVRAAKRGACENEKQMKRRKQKMHR